MSEEFLSIEDLAELLAVPVNTVRQWRRKGTGPPAVTVGKHLRFYRPVIDAWLGDHADFGHPPIGAMATASSAAPRRRAPRRK